jgi:hypothetical protein
MFFTNTVPVFVPSVTKSSLPFVASVAVKYSLLLKVQKLSGSEPCAAGVDIS